MTRTETRLDVADGIASLTLNRPEIRNAITGPNMLDEIVAAIEEAEADPSVSVLVITGEGTAFSAGGDVKEMRSRSGMFSGTPDQIAEAQEALAMGIVMEVVAPGELMNRVGELARAIASKPPHSVRLAKRLLRHSRHMELDAFLDMSASFQALSHHTHDHCEAMEAFVERRPGKYQGS